jgi:hypothetical protein
MWLEVSTQWHVQIIIRSMACLPLTTRHLHHTRITIFIQIITLSMFLLTCIRHYLSNQSIKTHTLTQSSHGICRVPTWNSYLDTISIYRNVSFPLLVNEERLVWQLCTINVAIAIVYYSCMAAQPPAGTRPKYDIWIGISHFGNRTEARANCN